MKSIYLGLTLVCTTILSGCGTSLNSKHLENAPTKGVLYGLPFTTFSGAVSYRPVSCKDDEIKIATSITAEKQQALDEKRLFSISPADLSKFYNKAGMDIEFYEDSLFLKSINTNVDDQSVEIATQLVSTGFAIATGGLPTTAAAVLAAATPSAGEGFSDFCASKAEVNLRCSAKVIQTLTDIDDAQAEVDAATLKLKEAQAELIQYNEDLADLDGNLSQAQLDKLLVLKRNIRTHSVTLEHKTQHLAAQKGSITHSLPYSFPSDSENFESKEYSLPIDIIDGWLSHTEVVPTICAQTSADEVTERERKKDLKAKRSPLIKKHIKPENFILKLALQNVEGDTNVKTFSSSDESCENLKVKEGESVDCLKELQKINGGIFYRNPMRGKLVAEFVNTSEKKPLYTGPISQFGHINSLPFNTKTLESATTSATFSQEGYLTSYSYKSTKSSGEGVANLIDGVAGNYLDYKEARANARQQALDAQLKELTTQQSILEAQTALSSSAQETQELQSQIALINAQIEKLKAEALLRELQ